MSKATKNNGGIMERLVLPINAFKVKFGYWPIKMEAHVETIATLAARRLTLLELLKEKLVKVRPELVALQGAGCGR